MRAVARLRGGLAVALAGLVLAPVAGCDAVPDVLFSRSPSAAAAEGASLDDLPPGALDVVATGLDTPWEIRFLPDGDLLVTERRGHLVRIEGGGADGTGDRDAGRVVRRHRVPGVREVAEAGLMGLALHPGYPDPAWIYVCHTAGDGGALENRVVRFRLEGGQLSEPVPVLTGMAGAPVHDGCRLEFGPGGRLYVTMGDAGSGARAQDRSSLNGKILRITDTGDVPSDNPFGTPVWSWGHRNPQGLARDAGGRLWSTEHGPSGVASGRDELNRVRRGANHGWPEITGDESAPGMVVPRLHSGSGTWAPAGLAHLEGRLWFGGLRGRALYEVRGLEAAGPGSGDGPGSPTRAPGGPGGDGGEGVDAGGPRLIRHFPGELGRIRAVRAGPDGRLWFGTSNRDGRGRPRKGDDRIFRLDPDVLAGG